MLKILIIIFVLLIPTTSHSFTEDQQFLLAIAREQGKTINHPETIQAILLQETLAGKLGRIGDTNRPFGEKSYGVMQVKLQTAKFVLKEIVGVNPFKHDEKLLVMLMEDDVFNIRIGTYYFKWLLDEFNGQSMSWSKAVLAYNYGIGNVNKTGIQIDPNNYLIKVKNHIKMLRTYE